MRFLTKEWYQTMTDGSLGVQLRADDRAAVFSEELYQQVRAEKLKEWLADLREYLEEAYDEAAERQRFAEFHSQELEEFQTRTPAQILAKVADIRVLALGLSARRKCTGILRTTGPGAKRRRKRP